MKNAKVEEAERAERQKGGTVENGKISPDAELLLIDEGK